MSSDWETTTLLAHYDVRSGLSKSAKDFGSGFPFLTFKDVFYNYFAPSQLGDLVQSTEKDRVACSVQRGDVFLTRTSETMHELGLSCVALQDYPDATFNGFCKRLRPKPDCSLVPEFVGYYLRSPFFRRAMLAMSTMSTRASLNNEMIGRLDISFPSKHLQIRIAAILKSLDDRITLLRETNATLEAIAQALFKSWFVDFDPVRAKMEGRAPEGMDEATAALFPNSFEESELGLVPKGWRVGSLGEELKIAYGKNLPTTKLLEHGYPVYGGNGQIGFFDKYIYETRQVLIACRGAASGKVNQSSPKAFVTNNSLVLESDFESRLPFGYLKWYMLRSDLCPFVTGSAQPQVTIDNLKVFRMLVPDDSVLRQFEATTSVLEDRIEDNLAQVKLLESLRDTLLPRLISGQLRLSEAEAVI